MLSKKLVIAGIFVLLMVALFYTFRDPHAAFRHTMRSSQNTEHPGKDVVFTLKNSERHPFIRWDAHQN
jgi:hypothetical protein